MATSDEDSDDQQSWVELFCGLKGNEFLCEVSDKAPSKVAEVFPQCRPAR